jgi:hypothetical protein
MAKALQPDRSPKVTPIRPISPDLKNWIRNCIVPILVREYLATQKIQIVSDCNEVLETAVTSATAAKVAQ